MPPCPRPTYLPQMTPAPEAITPGRSCLEVGSKKVGNAEKDQEDIGNQEEVLPQAAISAAPPGHQPDREDSSPVETDQTACQKGECKPITLKPSLHEGRAG